ncbi:hypothetical protein Emed_003690 [Eimeria media]
MVVPTVDLVWLSSAPSTPQLCSPEGGPPPFSFRGVQTLQLQLQHRKAVAATAADREGVCCCCCLTSCCSVPPLKGLIRPGQRGLGNTTSRSSSSSNSSSSSSSRMEGLPASSSVDLSEVPQLLRKAEQAMKPPGFLGQLFGREADYDTATQLLQQCAQQHLTFCLRYKLARVFPEAASCYLKAAEAANKARDTHTEATLYVEAANCMRRHSLPDAVPLFMKGVSVLLATGRLAAAAKIHRQLAEEYENLGDREAAATHFLKASELFETDEFSKTQYSHCICRYAELLAWGGDDPSRSRGAEAAAETLETAARIFEAEGYKASQNNLLQYGAKDLFFKALLLRLAIPRQDPGEVVDLQLALGRYGERNPHFASSREAQMIKQLVAAAEERDSDAFAAAVESYDSITRLDPWKVHFLLKAKALLGGDGADAMQQPVRLGSDGEVDLS